MTTLHGDNDNIGFAKIVHRPPVARKSCLLKPFLVGFVQRIKKIIVAAVRLDFVAV